MNKITGKTITLTVNKSKMQIKYRGNWINGSDFYKKGWTDANTRKKCESCDKDLDSYNWYCDKCEIENKKAMAEIMNDVNSFLGANLK